MAARARRDLAILFGALLCASTATAATAFYSVLLQWGVTPFEWLLLGLYTVLVAWIGSSFWISVFGAAHLLAGRRDGPAAARVSSPGDGACRGARTAIVMPLYHEDAERALDGLQATYESLAQLDAMDGFHFFVLSDSRDGATCREEERAWLHLCRDLAAGGRVFYRRRRRNTGKKAGNIKEFCERWGRRYDYLIVLDADSVMSGPTIMRMVRAMERDRGLGLLQTWPVPVNGTTLFARVQQFAANVQGRLVAAGLSVLMDPCGTYWGHNAIIRVEAFMQSCGLPRLPGRQPLGGEILSHDFVEAALLQRRGWRIRIMVEAEGSYEEGPTNLIEHASRDRRWCQGNLQHIRLLFAEGLTFTSRMNLLLGIMSYVASPLWLAFIGLAVIAAARPPAFDMEVMRAWLMSFHSQDLPSTVPWLIGFTAALLLAPKMLAVALAGLEGERRRAWGGFPVLAGGMLLEIAFTAAIAPLMMLLHTEFVATALAGRSVNWAPQQRDADAIGFRRVVGLLGPRCALGALLAGAAAWWAPALMLWMLPLLASFVVAMPLVVWSSREQGRGHPGRTARLFATPPETTAPPVLARLRTLRARRTGQGAGGARRDDPVEAELSLVLGREPAS